MKQIIIFILLLILGIVGYNTYKDYQRFSLKNYSYKPLENITVTEDNKATLFNYHQAIEAVNGYVISQWSLNDIDVRNPEDDNETTKAAVTEYRNKLAQVKYFEDLLKNPITKTIVNTAKENSIKTLLSNFNDLKMGAKNAAVYELQKLLVKKGYDIPVDGLFINATQSALKKFEADNRLYPDGKMDVLTLEALLK